MVRNFVNDGLISYNLMSFSAYKTLYLFKLLLESPITYKEIQTKFLENKFINETFSEDSLRVYMNTMKSIGCEIEKTNRFSKAPQYRIKKHPFKLSIDDQGAKDLLELCNFIIPSLNISELVLVQKLLKKISYCVTNEEYKEKLLGLSPIKRIDSDLVEKLIEHTQNHDEITINYLSLNSRTTKEIIVYLDKMYIQDKKLYISGENSLYNEYSRFLVERIDSIVTYNTGDPTVAKTALKVIYRICHRNKRDLNLLPCERIIKKNSWYVDIEIESKNIFDIMQRIISYGNKCKVISPDDFKKQIIEKLKKIREIYPND